MSTSSATVLLFPLSLRKLKPTPPSFQLSLHFSVSLFKSSQTLEIDRLLPQRMPPKRKKTRTKEADAMADCVLPSDIIFCILSRLPVKSVHRFKAVCKPWRNLFATPNFIKRHYGQFSKNPENQNYMIYSTAGAGAGAGALHTISLFKIESDAKKPTNLDHPYPQIVLHMDFVGCLSGLVCLSFPVDGEWIHLWNPVLNLEKHLQLPKLELRKTESGENERVVSVGFGYDDEAHDFKVVRIGCFGGDEMNTGAEVYSSKTDSWREINTGLKKFRILSTKCDTIVGGNPYCFVRVDEEVSEKSHILRFDVKKSTFKMVPSSNLELEKEGKLLALMGWRGSLATIVWNEIEESGGIGVASVLVFDVDTKMWNRGHVFKPIEMNVERCLQCSNDGKVIGSCSDGKLFVLDPRTGHVKVTQVDKLHMLSLKIFEYSESLVTVNGMKPVEVVKHPRDDKDNDEADEDRPYRVFQKNCATLFW